MNVKVDCKESWAPKNWFFWTMVLEKTLESPLDCREIQPVNLHWKDLCWSWNSNTLATWCEELTYWKRLGCWEILKQEEKAMTEDKMVGWHHQLHGHEFELAPGVGDVQWSQSCCNSWGHRVRCDWTELTLINRKVL